MCTVIFQLRVLHILNYSQNQELVSMDTELTGQDIALLPPFAGG